MIKQDIIRIDPLYLDNSVIGEVALWRAVIIQNLEDLRLPPTNKKYRNWINQSIKWFRNADTDFYMICELADLSPQHILQQAHYLILSQKEKL